MNEGYSGRRLGKLRVRERRQPTAMVTKWLNVGTKRSYCEYWTERNEE
jgi:hypothetical protein